MPPPNGLELSCPAEAGTLPLIVAHTCGPGAPPYGPARRVSFSELLGGLDPDLYVAVSPGAEVLGRSKLTATEARARLAKAVTSLGRAHQL